MDENSATADVHSMVLSNLSRPEKLIDKIMDELERYEAIVEKLVTCYTRMQYNKKNQHLNYLGKFENQKKCIKNLQKELAHGGIEPTTFALLARRSNQLS
jgi:hypothetical protein